MNWFKTRARLALAFFLITALAHPLVSANTPPNPVHAAGNPAQIIAPPLGPPPSTTDATLGPIDQRRLFLDLLGELDKSEGKPDAFRVPISNGSHLREFFRDMIVAVDAPVDKQAFAMKSALAKHPEILLWSAEGKDLNPIFAEAGFPVTFQDNTIAKLVLNLAQKQAREILAARGFEDAVKRAIERQSRYKLGQELGGSAIAGMAQKRAVEVATKFTQINYETRVRLLAYVPDSHYVEAAAEINSRIARARVRDVEAFRELLKSIAKFEIKSVNPEVIQSFIEMYFDELSLEDRRRVIIAYFSLAPLADQTDQISAIVNNLPPTIQKLFQLIGKDARDKKVQAVMKKILDGVQPFTDPVKPLLTQRLGRPWNEVFRSISEEPIAAGTIGQVYLAELLDGTPVVVKVRRPGLVARLEREMESLDRILEANRKMIENNPKLAAIAKTGFLDKLVDRLKEITMQEMDFKREAKLLDRAVAYIDEKLGISVVRRVQSVPILEDVLVMTRAPGTPLSKMGVDNLELQQKAVFNLIKKWIDLALFEGVSYEAGEPSSFYHADAHGGNFFLKALEQSSDATVKGVYNRMLGSNPEFLVTLIDFGNSGEMTLSQRRSFVRMALGAMTGSIEQIVTALGTLGNLSMAQKANIQAALEKLDFQEMGVDDRLKAAMEESLANGFEVPEGVAKLLRGKAFLEKEIARINDEIWISRVDERIRKKDLSLPLQTSRAVAQFLVGASSGEVTPTMDALEVLATIPNDEVKMDIDSALMAIDFMHVDPAKRHITALWVAERHGATLKPGSKELISKYSAMAPEFAKLSKSKYTANRAYLEVVAQRLGVSLPSQVFSQKARENAVVELSALTDAAKRLFREYFEKAVSTCLRRKIAATQP